MKVVLYCPVCGSTLSTRFNDREYWCYKCKARVVPEPESIAVETQPQSFTPLVAGKRYPAPAKVEQTFLTNTRWKFLTPIFLLLLAGIFPVWIWIVRSLAKVDLISYGIMSLGLLFPAFSLIYGYFWHDSWHRQQADILAPACAKCGENRPGAIGKFYFGTKIDEQVSKSRYINTIKTTTMTSYEILGSEVLYICDMCAKSHRLKDLRSYTFQVLGGILIPTMIALIWFLVPRVVVENLGGIRDILLILVILSIIGGVLAILSGIELIGRIVVEAIRNKRGRPLHSGLKKITQFEESLFDDPEAGKNAALDYDRDNIAIDLRKNDLGNQYIYWIRATYNKLRAGSIYPE